MKKKNLKGIAGIVSSVLLVSTISTAIPLKANASTTTNQVNTTETELNEFFRTPTVDFLRLNQDQLINEFIEKDKLSLEDFGSLGDIPQELFEPNYYSEEEIIYIPESYLNPFNPDAIGTTYVSDNTGDGQIQTYAAITGALAGVYSIPVIGQVTITVTGAIIVGGVIIAAGSWVYNEVSTYFAKKTAEKAADKIPNDLKSGDMTVDLGKFKNKNQKTAKETTAGAPFNYGSKWYLEKDNAGHVGYNGEKKAWKLWKKGASKRTASLDKKGNVIDE